jgi:D-sedoheptulose 7-phosphate isomerase
MTAFTEIFLSEFRDIVKRIEIDAVEKTALLLANVKMSGRLFIIGVGGSAASASHAANDFRKLCGFDAYCLTDNVSELTARINDEGWETAFEQWLKCSRLNKNDALLIFSVGGGNEEKNISVNIVRAVQYAKKIGAKIVGVVGRDGGFTAKNADICVICPVVNNIRITPHTEAFHGVIWHLLASHPLLKNNIAKWESEDNKKQL